MIEWLVCILCIFAECEQKPIKVPNFYQKTNATLIEGNLALTKDGLEYTVKKYTKVYMEFFGYDRHDFIPCEICHTRAADIHHIDARGMGGNPKGDKDEIENLMALCRKHHDKYGDKKQHKDFLKKIHFEFIKKHSQ